MPLAAGLLIGGCESPAQAPQTPTTPSREAKAEPEPEANPEPEAKPEPVVKAEPASGPLAPFPEAVKKELASIRPDPAPEHLVRDTHYWISNEQSHFLWHPHVQNVGGAFVGVATDQNYMLAAWAGAELLVLMDFDAGVVDLHHAYGVFFRESENAAALLARFTAANEEASVALLREHLPAAQVEASVEAYQQARPRVEERLLKVQAQYEALALPTFLSDDAQYQHLRTLWRNGRVVAVRGDLTADRTMVDLGDALRAADLRVGVLYLSNAEQYFKYTPAFRRNVLALPMAEEGVVLRTNGWRQFGYVADEEYHYNVQPAPLFAQWMELGHAWGVPPMLGRKTKTKTRGFSILDRAPERNKGRAKPQVAERIERTN